MSKNTSISLGAHFEDFVSALVATGRYGNKSEVIRAALRDMEELEAKKEALRSALIAAENSGPYKAYEMEEIIQSARKKADLDA